MNAHNGDEELVVLPQTAPAPHAGDIVVGRVDGATSMTVTAYFGDPAGSDAVSAVAEYAARFGLSADLSLAPQAVRLTGPVTALERCFGVTVSEVQTARGVRAIVPDAAVRLPAALAKNVVAVLGLDTRPVAHRRDEGTS